MLSEILIRLRSLLSRERVEAELDEEIRFHQQQLIGRYMKSGLSAAESAPTPRSFRFFMAFCSARFLIRMATA